MKKIVISLCLLISILSGKLKACDVCGCSIGGSYIGILPQFHKHFIGFNYSSRYFTTEHQVLGSESKLSSKEHFQSYELRGRFHLSRKIQLFIFIPYTRNKQDEKNVASVIKGLGDITAFANYSIFNNGDNLSRNWKHNFQAGAGIKLPTGNYQKLDANNYLNQNLQPGTGSYDLILDAIYTIRIKKYGLNNSIFYRLNSSNPNQFKFGDRLTMQSNLFYWANIHGFSLLPNVGINFDHVLKDRHNSSFLGESGGNSFFTNFGLDFYFHQLTIGTNIFIPISQDNSLIKNGTNYSVTLHYNF